MRDPAERLRDALEAIQRIEERCVAGHAAFEGDQLLQVWVVHHLQIVGEACRSLSDDFRRRRSSVPWSRIIGMRHILVHHYFDVDVEVVWSVVERDLPAMKLQLEGLLAELDGAGSGSAEPV